MGGIVQKLARNSGSRAEFCIFVPEFSGLDIR
jgi:hypothetical protein